jgi:hypothetical protein
MIGKTKDDAVRGSVCCVSPAAQQSYGGRSGATFVAGIKTL